jgi:putative hydrolase of the HAD superfamily
MESLHSRELEFKAMRARLREAKWYAFDLDDTLHSFRKASGAAATAVLQVIHKEHNPPCSLEELEAEYKRILAQRTAAAFVDGKTSHQYREERLRLIAHKWDLKVSQEQMQVLLDYYELALMASLELKSGVLDLLKTLRQYGHKIAVITEGPQDAQERTVDALGLTPFISYLATTNKLRIAKVDGLYAKVLEHLNITSHDMIMIGDSWERDIVPAKKAGIYCIHYTENEETARDMTKLAKFDHLTAVIKDTFQYSN